MNASFGYLINHNQYLHSILKFYILCNDKVIAFVNTYIININTYIISINTYIIYYSTYIM